MEKITIDNELKLQAKEVVRGILTAMSVVKIVQPEHSPMPVIIFLHKKEDVATDLHLKIVEFDVATEDSKIKSYTSAAKRYVADGSIIGVIVASDANYYTIDAETREKSHSKECLTAQSLFKDDTRYTSTLNYKVDENAVTFEKIVERDNLECSSLFEDVIASLTKTKH